MRTLEDGFNQFPHQFRVLATIAIYKDDNLAVSGERADASRTGTPVTTPRLSHHARPGLPGAFDRAVVAAVIHNDHVTRDLARHSANHVGDGRFFIEGRNYDRNTRLRWRVMHNQSGR